MQKCSRIERQEINMRTLDLILHGLLVILMGIWIYKDIKTYISRRMMEESSNEFDKDNDESK